MATAGVIDLPALLDAALTRRADLLRALAAEDTDCHRCLHGIAEGAPGVTIDRYGPVLLVQTWRAPVPVAILAHLAQVAERHLGSRLIPVWNHRRKPANKPFAAFHDPALPAEILGRECGLVYDVHPRHRGQDPPLFLDLRVGRRRVRAHGAGEVLNLFAYTCGVGVAAAAAGAHEVWNVDFAASALEIGRANAARNGVAIRTIHHDVIPVVRQLAGLGVPRGRGHFERFDPRTFDLVVLDPPRFARGKFGAVDVVRDYAGLFKPAVLTTRPGGVVLACNNAAQVDLDDWVAGLNRCADKAGRPIASVEILAPDADFPTFDGNAPLKIAWVVVA